MPDFRNQSILGTLIAVGIAIAHPLTVIQSAQAQAPAPAPNPSASPSPAAAPPAAAPPAAAPAQAPAPTPTPAPAATPAPRADLPLVERTTYVGTCRSSGSTALPVYSSSTLGQTVATLQPYTRIVLTGVLGNGTAQISNPSLGWVRSATLLTDCDAGEETGGRGACYQVAPAVLAVRTAPYGNLIASLAQNQRVYATAPPNRQTTSDGRIWLQVFYNQTSNLGWMAQTGTGGLGANLVSCP
ncbi:MULTISPECIES: hypothetical protein [unclassified Leptolyngbya]|uniref:hypothetical protein n=1 Tax=unclassified Leptolyngbya TaxID=2650499 RepID=UPI0016852493|nr:MULTISPECIES: hypothetical protein [unclassified Leptolyngbya]MBD1911820.1 hypothetical protein [Leptolyngbya sp. FACHB-8]MBD2153290.1 hypothetical protein [Leptolyngbya sp. FACHB-16]